MRTAPVKAIVLPAVYRANLEFQLHVPFQNSRMRIIDLRTHGRRGFCTLVHSYLIDILIFDSYTHIQKVSAIFHIMVLQFKDNCDITDWSLPIWQFVLYKTLRQDYCPTSGTPKA